MEQIKLPKDIQELLYEAQACNNLAAEFSRGLLPSLKAVCYATRGARAEALAHKALRQTHPRMNKGVWLIKLEEGIAVDTTPVVAKPKAPRKPRTAPTDSPTVVPTTTKGESK